MRPISRGVTLSVTALIVVSVLVVMAIRVTDRSVGEDFRTFAMFRDASTLPVGSRVVIAGVQVGEIAALSIEGDLARVDMVLRNQVVLWSDAVASKKLSSLLGDAYIEIAPGGPVTPEDPVGDRVRLASGQQIRSVVEASSTDRVLRALDRSIPRVNENLATASAALIEARKWVQGPAATKVAEIDRWLAGRPIESRLASFSSGVDRFDAWTASMADATAGSPAKVNRALDRFAADVAGATRTMKDADGSFREAMSSARRRMDDVDSYLAAADRWFARMGGDRSADDGEPVKRTGFGKLVADPELGASIDEGAEAIADFTSSLNRLKTWMGMRLELNVLSVAPRLYMIAQVYGRGDSFVQVELEKGPLGDIPTTQLADQIGSDEFLRTSVIEERIRFTGQWGRRLGNTMQVRFGIKESSFGFGADVLLGGGRLRLESDLFELSTHRTPRLKVAAAVEVYRQLYILGGIDDALVPGAQLPIQPWTGNDVPIQFEKVRYGRDYFFGLMLRFDEPDLNHLLFLYGAALFALLQ